MKTFYITEQQLSQIIQNSISYGSNKLDERFALVQKISNQVKTQELEEVQEQIQTELKKSVVIKETPKNIVSYQMGTVMKENVTPYLNKYGFSSFEKSETPKFLVVDWDTKCAVFSDKKTGEIKSMSSLFEQLDTIKEAKTFRDSASSLLEEQEFSWI